MERQTLFRLTTGTRIAAPACRGGGPRVNLQSNAPTKKSEVAPSHGIHVWYICLHEWLIFVNAGKYTIHGSYGHGIRQNCLIRKRLVPSLKPFVDTKPKANMMIAFNNSHRCPDVTFHVFSIVVLSMNLAAFSNSEFP